MPQAYIHPRGLPSRAIYFTDWKNFAPKYKAVAAKSLTPGRRTQHIQSIGRDAPGFKIVAFFDELSGPSPESSSAANLLLGAATGAPAGAGTITGADKAWRWFEEWMGDAGDDVEGVFLLNVWGNKGLGREVFLEEADPVAESIIADEDGRILRFECSLSGVYYTETFHDPALFNKPRQALAKAKKTQRGGPLGPVVGPGINSPSVFDGPLDFGAHAPAGPFRGADTDANTAVVDPIGGVLYPPAGGGAPSLSYVEVPDPVGGFRRVRVGG